MAEYMTSEEIQAELSNLADELGISLSEVISVVNGNIDAVSGKVDAANVDIAGIKSELQKLTEVGELDSESLVEKLNAVQTILDGADADTLDNLLASIAANTKVAEQAVADAKTNADALQAHKDAVVADNQARDAKISDNVTQVADLVSKTAANKKASDAIAANVGELSDTVVANKKAADATKTGLDALTEKVNNASVIIDANKTKLDDVATSTLANSNSIEGIKTAMAETAETVSDFEATITAKVNGMIGSGLEMNIVCGRKAANAFRLRMNQEAKTFDCGQTDTDSDGLAT